MVKDVTGGRMSRLLFVVSRAEPKRYEYLRTAFAGEEAMEIVFDRRVGQRRRSPMPYEGDRRRGDRRARDLNHELDRLRDSLVRRHIPGPRPHDGGWGAGATWASLTGGGGADTGRA